MPFIPPWLAPTDTLGAIHSGAQLGLTIRAQNEAAAQAADQLRLQQESLMEQKRQHDMLMQERAQQVSEEQTLARSIAARPASLSPATCCRCAAGHCQPAAGSQAEPVGG